MDKTLAAELHDWRVRKALGKRGGEGKLRLLGPGFIMPTETLDHIVTCVHFKKIKAAEDIVRETRWVGAREYGEEIYQVIVKVCPLPDPAPLMSTQPLQSRALNNQHPAPIRQPAVHAAPVPLSVSGSKTRKKAQCGACGLLGHYSTLTPLVRFNC